MNRKRVGIAAAVILLVFAVLLLRDKGVPVETYTMEIKPFAGYIEETGIVEAKGAREIQAVVTGRVAVVKVAEGQTVKAGDSLAIMEKGDVLTEVERTYAAVKVAKAQLAGAVKGAGVNEMVQAKAEVNQALNNLAEAQRQAGQAAVLLKSGGISSEEYQQKITTVNLQKNNLAIAQARLRMLQSGAGTSERQALQAQVEQAEAQMKTAELQLNEANITAPIDGVVLRKYIEPGTFVQPGTSLFKVGSPSKLVVSSDVLETEAIKIKTGQKVNLAGEVLEGQTLTGKVTEVAPEAVIKISSLGVEQRRVPIKILLYNNGGLKPGFNVDIRIIIGEKQKTLFVPEQSLWNDQNRDFVFVVVQGSLVKRQVTTGLKNHEFIEITGGLKAGEEVVKEPDNQLTAGTKVTSVESTN